MRFSTQKNVRIPSTEEFFGNGFTVLPSLRLKPEHSYNLNLGFNSLLNSGSYPNLMVDVNGYAMWMRDMIRMVAASILYVHSNVDRVRIFGVDAELQAALQPWASLRLSASYQDARNDARQLLGGGLNSFYGWRVPNMPYHFGNGLGDFHLSDLFPPVRFEGSFFFEVAFTERYSYDWATSVRNTLYVPRRWTMHLGFYGHYQLAFEVHNLVDREPMAEFNYPLPGRTFHLKLKYTL